MTEAKVAEAPGCDPGDSGFESRQSPQLHRLRKCPRIRLHVRASHDGGSERGAARAGDGGASFLTRAVPRSPVRVYGGVAQLARALHS